MPASRRYATRKPSAAARARAAKRRKGRLSRVENDLTEAQWDLLLELWAGCAYCRATDTALQRDCIQPVSRGGRYTIGNVAPACRSCNASKNNSEVTGWLRRRKLDERAFLLRHAQILAELADREPAADAGEAAPADAAAPEAPLRCE
ncbi:HNH endonuclease [Leucobacter sp. CSA2]|uniref:HNH endonuclease n=1 Tax=Leucobacter edaphi TaxID=2796472 RepID=A0A934QAQ8_9MICO|nr:HNH endonuclease [Leucobacter edaphi]